MHLWPSAMIRDSFKIEYLKKVEWNMRRMNSEKQRQPSSANQSLLEKGVAGDDNSGKVVEGVPAQKSHDGFLFAFKDSLMVLSCCCCCFGCGVCIDEEGSL